MPPCFSVGRASPPAGSDEQLNRTNRKLDEIGRQLGDLGLVKEEVGRYAEQSGLYVLTQTDEGGAALLNREGFEPRAFG